ncbi:MAG TPA: methionyl-tRNA formyltransferase, partial [Candidatus Polarisedimenticolaceae bacterium]|nr:methionyl-tRNA formyltransferase [Candidatus Polarisedimenticolaceae bacterium]
MRLVFLGTPSAAVPALAALLRAGHEVARVVTQPDRPVGRSRRPAPPPVKQAALDAGLELLQPRRVKDEEFPAALRSAAPELLVVVAYGRILSDAVLELAPRGAINLHFSLLPRYRGAAPVQWALARGETTTGVSTMRIVSRLDAGDVLLQRAVPIAAGEHAPALEQRLAAIGAELLVATLAGLARGELRGTPQDEAQATYAPLLHRADGELDPTLAAPLLEGHVRGFDPWPGSWVRVEPGGRRLRLVEARALDERGEQAPGSVLELRRDGLVVACG